MRRAALSYLFGVLLLTGSLWFSNGGLPFAYAADVDPSHTIVGTVQNQDLRRVDQATVQVRDQEGNLVTQGVTNQAGEFYIIVPEDGTYSISAVQDTFRSEYVVVKIGARTAAACVAHPRSDPGDCLRDRIVTSGDPIQGLERNVPVEPKRCRGSSAGQQ